jgi:hypothetical protein
MPRVSLLFDLLQFINEKGDMTVEPRYEDDGKTEGSIVRGARLSQAEVSKKFSDKKRSVSQ